MTSFTISDKKDKEGKILDKLVAVTTTTEHIITYSRTELLKKQEKLQAELNPINEMVEAMK